MSLAIQRIPDGEDVWGRMKVVYKDLILDSSYPSGGYPINASDVGLKMFYEGIKVGGNVASGGVMINFDQTTGLGTSTASGVPPTKGFLRVLFPSGGGGTSPSTLASAAIAAGATGVTSAAANGSTDLVPGIGVEVATGCNLSTITIRMRFTGR